MSTVLERSRIQLPTSEPGPRPPRRGPARRSGARGFGAWLASWSRRLLDLVEKVPKPRWRRLGLAMQSQLQSQWCWAACSTSISHFYDAGSSWTQCTVVNAELTETNCCQNGSTAECNQPWYLDRALTRTGNFASSAAGAASMSTLRTQLSAGHPVGVRIGWAGGGGHFVMISGCLDDATGMLEVRDPIYGTSEISIANFASSYQGSGSWTHTFYTRA